MMKKSEINLESIEEMAKYLRLTVFKDYQEIIDHKLPFNDNLKLLLKTQCIKSQISSLERRLKLSGLPAEKNLETFELSQDFFTYLNLYDVIELRSCKFIDNKLDVIAIGPPGHGKTHLAAGIGIDAIKKGYSVIFKKSYNMFNEMQEAQSKKELNDYIKKLTKVQLLIIDEVGFHKYNEEHTQYFFQIVSERYETRSTIYTTNLEFKLWDTFISNPQLLDAIIDRIIHHSVILNMDGKISWRLKNAYSKNHQTEKKPDK
ncbi:MAG: IS21-like element helper ATPase IstB [Clostridiales Family XIII bacterium]|jgi:DNA replication protein DnaC|nr:IS21-like element helper ATPase IstB [Clostridiales Family XIII bacterium]